MFEDMLAADEQTNDFVNQLRDEVRAWRDAGYAGTANVTRRLLEWWFERDEERKAEGQRLFFCQREAIETVIYLYEVQNRRRMPETGDLLRYALKLATGTGKTVVMALLITWATLHKRKVSNSSLSANFLVLVPNLTVRDRVSGVPRGDGLDPAGADNLYAAFDMIPPEYQDEFHPNLIVKNWQAIPLEDKRDDWIAENDLADEGRFVPASVLWALQRRARADPNTPIRKFLGGWRDLVVINDEAHHVYGEKRGKKDEEAAFIKWSKILDRVGKAARISLVVDLSATPWYGSSSVRDTGTLFEWLVSDFSVYDAFESGLVKVVRLPDQQSAGVLYLDLWDQVSQAKTKEEYLTACKGAIASIYSDWSKDYQEWAGTFEILRPGPAPVLLVVADKAQRAQWLFEHLSQDGDYNLLRNPADEEPQKWHTIRIDTGVFDAEKGNEAVLREMVNTVGKPGAAGVGVRCIVSVNMLSEGWDVKAVTHILGLRAFGSPLLTEQIIGRGLRRANYDILNQPLAERPDGADETVDAFGIPFIGFPVQKRKRQKIGGWGDSLEWIDKDDTKSKYRVRVPNVRAWAVGVTRPLSEVIQVNHLNELTIDPKHTPPDIRMLPVVGGNPETIMHLDEFRKEHPLLKTAFATAKELFDLTSPGQVADQGTGPTFDELLDVVRAYLAQRVKVIKPSLIQDIGISYWRQQMLNILATAIQSAGSAGVSTVPVLGDPPFLDTERLRRYQWTGLVAKGKKSHTRRVPCHSSLEQKFADFLDDAGDVLGYLKNERFGFSVTYYENNRPRQYYPDFIALVRDPEGREVHWVIETKGEVHPNTNLKRQAADLWCQKMSQTEYGSWRYLYVPQDKFTRALTYGVQAFAQLVERMPQSLTWE
jgi:type III restriction enzyme